MQYVEALARILLAGYKSIAWILLIWVFSCLFIFYAGTQTNLDQYVMRDSAIEALEHENDLFAGCLPLQKRCCSSGITHTEHVTSLYTWSLAFF